MKEIIFDDLEINQHLWAIMDDKLVVLYKADEQGYYLCGPYENMVYKQECTPIALIEKPQMLSGVSFYYED